MTRQHAHDALVSVRLAADLCGIPTGRVLALISSETIRPVTIQGRQLVSLAEVEGAIGEGKPHAASL